MEQKLGQIEKPKVTVFLDARKLFCLPLISSIKMEEGSEVLRNSIDLFWREAGKQIDDLERAGRVSYVFYESMTKDGEAGLEMMKQIRAQSYSLVKEKLGKGAKLVIIEDEEVLGEFVDWSICLSVIRKSQKVFNKVLMFYKDVTDRRNNEIAKRIDNALEKKDSGLLVMTDENRLHVQSALPSDIQVFLIHPPSLNDITQWIRDYWNKQSSN